MRFKRVAINLLQLLEPLKNNVCNGKIIIDLSLWNISQFLPYHMPEDYPTNYCRLILPVIINKNSIEAICELTNDCVVIRNNSGYAMKNEMLIHDDALKLPDQTICINSTKSKPLHTIVRTALKSSDNIVFDALYFTLISNYLDKQVIAWD